MVIDAELRVQTGNRTFYEMFGISREAAQGVPLNNLGNEAWKGLDVWSSLRATFANNNHFQTVEVQRDVPSGGRRTLLLDARRLSSKGSVLVLLVLQDISERKQAEEAVRKSEQRFRQLLSLMPSAVYTCDYEGRITFFNRRAAELWGREPAIGDEDQKFCGAFKLWLPDGSLLPHAQTPMAVAVQQGTPCRDREVVIERPDGSRVTVCVNIDPLFDPNGDRCGAINVFQDVTERKRAEQALAAKVRQQHAVAELGLLRSTRE